MKFTRHSINDRNEIVSKISNLPIRMEKDDRTCETKDPVYIYTLSRFNASVFLDPPEEDRGSRGSRGEEVVDGQGYRFNLVALFVSPAVDGRGIDRTYLRPIPDIRSSLNIETIAYTDRNECCRRCRQRLSTSFDPSFAFGIPETPDLDRPSSPTWDD